MPVLISVLNNPNQDMRVCAVLVLSRSSPAARATVSSLIQAIEHPDPQHHAQTLGFARRL